MTSAANTGSAIGMGHVVKTWLPLASSWLFMGAELPLLSAVVARLANPEIHLAAYGGVVFPIALIIESPIIMLLAASTALSTDWDAYRVLRRFMVWAGALLTTLHVLVVFTPFYPFIVEHLIGAPVEIRAPARLGLMLMIPWTWAIAYRRFNQGVLIRFGYSNSVGIGTFVRLCSNAAVLTAGYLIGTIPGIVVATSAVSTGVLCEALYVWFRVRSVIRNQLKPLRRSEAPLTMGAFFQFYVPLALTSLFSLFVQPIVTAAMSRMPSALESLAVWPALNGFVFMTKALGIAYNEVVVALLGRQGGFGKLRQFTWILTSGTVAVLVLIAATPLASIWFAGVAGLKANLVLFAKNALWLALLMPGMTTLMSWYQGILVHNRRTRAITESVVIYLLICAVALFAGVEWGRISGLYVGVGALTFASLCQTLWQWYRTKTFRQSAGRDWPERP